MRRWVVAGVVLVLGVVAGVVVATGWPGARDADVPFVLPDICQATVDGHEVLISPEQAQNAGLITAIAVRRGLPARAASIALATAFQESDLRNLDHGDRDSLGLFQQRPSQGWGTRAQVQDATHATNRFYDALVRVAGYRDLDITVAGAGGAALRLPPRRTPTTSVTPGCSPRR